MWLLALLAACDSTLECEEGQVRQDGECVSWSLGTPVEADVWQPTPGTSWQWQLTGTIDTSLDVEMYDVDLFEATDAALADLSDKVVICYFSAGSWEDWRDDIAGYPEERLGRPLRGWPGERWVDVMDPDWRAIVEDRLDLAVSRGCDGVEPDNVTAFDDPSGLPVNATEQLNFNSWLADEAHARDLSVGLKNDVHQLSELEPFFDWALNEECVKFEECGGYVAFTGEGKATFHTEYVGSWDDAQDLADEVCGVGPDLDTLIKLLELGPEYLACP